MRNTLILAILFTLISTPLLAASVAIDVNEEAFQLGFENSLTDSPYGDTSANVRVLYNSDEETKLLSAGIDFLGKPGNITSLTAGLGLKAYVGSSDPDVDFANLALGLRAGYTFPQLLGLGIEGHIFYAPSVLSFRDSDSLLDGQIRLTYPIIPKAKVFIGYQNIKLESDSGSSDDSVDKGLRVGFIGTF